MRLKINILLSVTAMVFLVSCPCLIDCDEDPVLSVEPSATDIIFAASGVTLASGDSAIFTVSTNNQTGWNVSSSERWVTIIDRTPNTFTLIAAANSSLTTTPPPAVVTIAAGRPNKSAIPVFIRVTQLPDEPYLIVIPSDTFVAFDAEGNVKPDSNATFNVVTNVEAWDVFHDQPWWLKMAFNFNYAFTLSAEPNTSQEKPRAVTVTVSAGKAQSVEITVTQDAAQP